MSWSRSDFFPQSQVWLSIYLMYPVFLILLLPSHLAILIYFICSVHTNECFDWKIKLVTSSPWPRITFQLHSNPTQSQLRWSTYDLPSHCLPEPARLSFGSPTSVSRPGLDVCVTKRTLRLGKITLRLAMDWLEVGNIQTGQQALEVRTKTVNSQTVTAGSLLRGKW